MNNNTNSQIIYVARLHWILFFWPVIMAVAGSILYFIFPEVKPIAIFFVAFALLWFAMTWVTYQFSSLTIKKKQVILRSGLLVRQTVDIPMAKIETIDIRQSLAGSLFRYGMLVITGTGGTRHFISYLNKPLTCRRYIEQLMHAP